jgi:hypothetical protein
LISFSRAAINLTPMPNVLLTRASRQFKIKKFAYANKQAKQGSKKLNKKFKNLNFSKFKFKVFITSISISEFTRYYKLY